MSDNIITPNNIFQTHKSIAYIKTKPKISKAIKSWKKNSNLKYYFYDNLHCEQFIKTNFDESVYKAYMRLPLAVMKADLWRYCIIYHYGGIYADTDAICLNNPKLFLNNTLLTVAPENETHLCNWTFSAPKGSPILKRVIKLSVTRILSIHEIKGEHIIHELTGPGVFTHGIEQFLREKNLPTYSNKLDYQKYKDQNMMVFNRDIFHTKIIKHLFTGQDHDGWCNERFQKLV